MDIQNFEETGIAAGLTFRQAAEVVSRATGNDVRVNPFDARSIERAALGFGDNNSGRYPHITARHEGGFNYSTISDRTLSIYPNGKGWVLDCSSWWGWSENFRGSVVACLKEVLVEKALRDASVPESEPEHVHGQDELIGQEFRLYHTPVNNHGCRGFSVEVEATSPTEGKVVDGQSCSSCWQVGHDRSDPPVPIGSWVQLPDGYCWLCACEEDPYFMSSRDTSRNGRTTVEPSHLVVLAAA